MSFFVVYAIVVIELSFKVLQGQGGVMVAKYLDSGAPDQSKMTRRARDAYDYGKVLK